MVLHIQNRTHVGIPLLEILIERFAFGANEEFRSPLIKVLWIISSFQDNLPDAWPYADIYADLERVRKRFGHVVICYVCGDFCLAVLTVLDD